MPRRLNPSDTTKTLHNLRQILLNSNATPIKLHNVMGYMCAFCPKQYLEPRELKKHFLEGHNDAKLIARMAGLSRTAMRSSHVVKLDITLLNCALCDSNFDSLQDLSLHLIERHGKKLYTDTPNQLLPFKFNTPEMRCAICSLEFASFKVLQQHMNTHFKNYICPICNAGFVVERLLTNHCRRHVNENVKCSECEKTFVNTITMREHLKRAHLGLDKRCKCQFCDQKFQDYRQKMNHMTKEHGVPPLVLKCGACDRNFANKRALWLHTKKDHLLERKHACTHCDMKFFSSSSLKEHLPKHTGIKKFQCEVCSKYYVRQSTLNVHMRLHKDDRKFVCNHCDLSFVQKCRLIEHLRSKHLDTL